ncbi:MAG: sulfate ABC transporter permease subunit CysW [Cyanobacteria bacterium P01_C01_bin.89]
MTAPKPKMDLPSPQSQTPPADQSPPPASNQPPEEPNAIWLQRGAIAIALLYLAAILFLPALNVFIQAFQNGVGPFLETLQSPDFQSAAGLTLLICVLVIPVNAAFGICAAIALARSQFTGRAFVISLLDLPFSISPVVVGLMMVLLYGRRGWFGPALEAADIKIVFALPGMIIATAFVTLPFVAREVLPLLEEMGTDQEEAARILGASNWQVFWRITLPNIRWGLLYGTILSTARALGEFGAVSVVSGNIIRKTQTLPLFVEEAYKQYETQAAYSAAVVLALLAAVALILKTVLEQVLSKDRGQKSE